MLETTRLKLVPLLHEHLLLFKNDPEALYQTLGTKYMVREHDPVTLPHLIEATEFWINNTKAHPEQFEWWTSWEIILKHENVAIGGIGFAGFPDEDGKSMTGYGLDMRYHRKGYATEALGILSKWGFTHPELKRIIAETPINHIASHKVLLKNRFVEYQRDEELIHWKLDR